MKKYFVMLNTHQSIPVPMTDENDEILLYDNKQQAAFDAYYSPLGRAYGFMIYFWNSDLAVVAYA